MIVITTPTGDIGSQVVERLLAADEPFRVVVRDPSKLSAEVRERAEVVEGSHGDPDVVERAFTGADAVLWIVPPNPGAESLEVAYLDFTRPAAEAFTRLGVTRVVVVSALGRGVPGGRDGAGLVSVSLAMDDLVSASGVAVRTLAMPSFMDNLLGQADAIRGNGMFFSTVDGDLKAPTCATRDIAAVATRFLLDASWSGQEEVPVLGPEDLSQHDLAQIMSEVLGREIRYQQVSFEDMGQQLASSGASDAFVEGFVDMMRAKNEGLDNGVERTPEGSTPTSFRQWCEEVLTPAVEAS